MDIVFSVLASAVLGVLMDWLLKFVLPKKPRGRHIIAAVGAIGVLVLIVVWRFTPLSRPAQGFFYSVRVQSSNDLKPISNAKVTVDMGQGIAPLDEYTDSNGFARIQIDSTRAEKPGRLIVEAAGYKTYTQYLDIRESTLPDVIQLEPVNETRDIITPEATTSITQLSPTPTGDFLSASITPVLPKAVDTPFPSATPLSRIFDDFDDECISTSRWIPRQLDVTPTAPPPFVVGRCFDLSDRSYNRHFVEFAGNLIVTNVSQWEDGLLSLWSSNCRYMEVQLAISDFALSGKGDGWVGLVAHNPEGGSPISIWLTGRVTSDGVNLQIITTRGWTGSRDIQGAETIALNVEQHSSLILAVRFDGRKALPIVGNIPSQSANSISAVGFPGVFSIVYYADPAAELSASFDEVRLEPVSSASECNLPGSASP
ncbi:MAG TPA: hypothetical protein VJ124_00530 [Pyrinomonadaceae bacterium]|nr:hypothetical protein [Pyrinomonadaceae bacterium]